MNFGRIRVIAAAGPDGDRFAAVWTTAAVRSDVSELTIGPGLDSKHHDLLERIGACELQPEADLRKRLSEFGLSENDIAEKFASACQWTRTITVSAGEYRPP